MQEAFIVDAVRTPMGRHGGALATVRPDDLAALVIRALVDRNRLAEDTIDDVYFGCANQAGEDNRNVARMALLLAGLPPSVPGATVNRLCGSGLEAVAEAARAIMVGEGDLFIAGGVESMTRAPYVLPKPERGFERGKRTLYDTTLGWRMVNPKMPALGYDPIEMGETAENVAEQYNISRESQDRFAFESQQKAARALREGAFEDEIVAVSVPQRNGPPKQVTQDEPPRPQTTLEDLANVHEMKRRETRYGLATMCIGVGQGIAMVVERTH